MSDSRLHPVHHGFAANPVGRGRQQLQKANAKVVFPHPESPQSPTMVPGAIANEISERTARLRPSTHKVADFQKGRCGHGPYFTDDAGQESRATHSMSAGRIDASLGNTRQQVHHGVSFRFGRTRIVKAHVETHHGQRTCDALAQHFQNVPHMPLLDHIQIVECGYVTARSNHNVERGERGGMGYGHNIVSENPGIFWCRSAIKTGVQTPNIHRRVLAIG